MLFALPFFVCGRLQFESNYRYDQIIGTISRPSGLASTLWVDTLVDQLPHMDHHISSLLRAAAIETANDLVRRMDRPIVGSILTEAKLPSPLSAEDDLAAGIVYWTLQWRWSTPAKNKKRIHSQAEFFLRKASHEGDVVQQSYAALAYAYCSLSPDLNAEIYDPARRFNAEYERRLKSVILRFRESVPERALRASRALEELYFHKKRGADDERMEDFIRTNFKEFSYWHSYDDKFP